MENYTPEDGLKVLEYLHLTNLTKEERKVFKEKWGDLYGHGEGLIYTTWTLYSEVLPFTCCSNERQSFNVHMIRDSQFGERLDESGLEGDLKSGKSLREIFDSHPENFYKWN